MLSYRMTRKLYYQDPLQRSFSATVVHAASRDKGYCVVLDQTCFYPEGGGQPADRGTLNGIPVVDVRKEDDAVIHVLARPLHGEGEPLQQEGTGVHGELDWEHRYDYMQQHTGQHIVSASMVHVGGYNTVAVHQGERYTTVECDHAEITDSQLARIEELANATVGRNLPLRAFEADESEARKLGLRREPKVAGTIRIVEIDGFDRVACGGVHLPTTGEVGMIKLVGTERIRGNLRTIWKIGGRALDDYREKTAIINALTERFSAQQHEIVERAEKLDSAVKQAQYNERALLKRLCTVLSDRLLERAVTTATAPRPEPEGAFRLVTHRFENEQPELFRGVLESLIERSGTCACLVNVNGDRLQWIIGCSPEVPLDFASAKKALLPLIGGKGGGRPSIWQGVGDRPAAADAFLAAFAQRFGTEPEA